MKKLTLYTLGASALMLGATSCEDENGSGNGDVVKEWTIALSGKQEVPSNNRSETGTAHLVLYSDNELKYEITVDGLASGDELTMAHVHTGDPVTSGPVSITVVDGENRTFSGNTAMGSVILQQEEVDISLWATVFISMSILPRLGQGLSAARWTMKLYLLMTSPWIPIMKFLRWP